MGYGISTSGQLGVVSSEDTGETIVAPVSGGDAPDDRAPNGAALPICATCGLIIGVYEPLVLCVDGRTWMTSLAAEPRATRLDGQIHHGACFEATE